MYKVLIRTGGVAGPFRNTPLHTCVIIPNFVALGHQTGTSVVKAKFHYTNFTETSPKLPRDKSPRLVYDLSPTCLGEVSGKSWTSRGSLGEVRVMEFGL